MSWYDDIEEEVIRRERVDRFRYDITPMEQQIADIERDVLAESTKGFSMATEPITLEHWYYTTTGERKCSYEHSVQHNTDYIARQIQQRISGWGVHTMTTQDIYDVLNVVSGAYECADQHGLDKPLISIKGKVVKLDKAG